MLRGQLSEEGGCCCSRTVGARRGRGTWQRVRRCNKRALGSVPRTGSVLGSWACHLLGPGNADKQRLLAIRSLLPFLATSLLPFLATGSSPHTSYPHLLLAVHCLKMGLDVLPVCLLLALTAALAAAKHGEGGGGIQPCQFYPTTTSIQSFCAASPAYSIAVGKKATSPLGK